MDNNHSHPVVSTFTGSSLPLRGETIRIYVWSPKGHTFYHSWSRCQDSCHLNIVVNFHIQRKQLFLKPGMLECLSILQARNLRFSVLCVPRQGRFLTLVQPMFFLWPHSRALARVGLPQLMEKSR